MMNEKDMKNMAMQKMISENLASAETIVCETCGNGTFVELMIMKKFSPIVTGTKQPMLLPIPCVSCNSCGAVVEELLPEPLRNPIKKPSILAEK